MTLPAVVRVELTPETRRLLLRLIEAVEKLARGDARPGGEFVTFAEGGGQFIPAHPEEPPNDEGLTPGGWAKSPT